MSATYEIKVGEQELENGQTSTPRGAKDGSVCVKQMGGTFQEAVKNGRCFTVANQVGITTQAGLSATTPALTLANPLGSGVNLILWYVGATFNVAFAAGAYIYGAVGTNLAAAAVTGTLTTAHRNCLLGGPGPSVVPFLAATLPAAPVAIMVLGAAGSVAISSSDQFHTMERWVNGSIILQPGSNFSVQTSTASGTLGMINEYIYEEVDA